MPWRTSTNVATAVRDAMEALGMRCRVQSHGQGHQPEVLCDDIVSGDPYMPRARTQWLIKIRGSFK